MTPLSRKFKALLLAERVALFVTLGSMIAFAVMQLASAAHQLQVGG